jgi:hypothetical protein
VQPRLREELVGGRGVGEGVGGVVGREQVLDDGAGFPERDVIVVGVGDGGYAAVGVNGFEGFCWWGGCVRFCYLSPSRSPSPCLSRSWGGKGGVAAYLGAER